MINLNSVSKKFNLYNKKTGLFGFLGGLFFKNKEIFFSLDKIDLNLSQPEVIGVIGRNGSGKTTLLKIIAGILEPTSGNVSLSSEAVYLSGFSTGINKNLTMLDNIYLIGVLNNLSKREIEKKIKDIVEFSELGEFINVPLYKFSNGMFSRFAFSATIMTLPNNPEILLLDEVIGAGSDAVFKKKIENKIDEYIKSSKIVMIVNHNSNYILNKCSKVIWLEDGKVKKIGDTSIVKEYLESLT